MSSKARRRSLLTPKAALPVLAYDLGGTKLAVGVVSSAGRVLDLVREPVVRGRGPGAVIAQMTAAGHAFLARYPRVRQVGVASAGPLHPERGVLLDPTNLALVCGGNWSEVPLAKRLSRGLRLPVAVENDAAAAILAEHWVGAARGCENAMILTLGTGLGTGVIANGRLVRAGRGLHPEGGHLILHAGDLTAPCGCGNLGCAEAFLSGTGFTRRAGLRHPRLRGLDAREISSLAKGGGRAALSAFDEYGRWLAIAIHNYAVAYAPEVVVLTGGFAETARFFLPRARRDLRELMRRRRAGIDLLPRLARSSLRNEAGVIGAARVALGGA